MPDAIAGVTPACRAEARRGAAPAVIARAHELTERSEPSWVDRGRMVLCAMQDPASLRELQTWMNDGEHPAAAAVCAAELATWPDSDQVRGTIFARAVRKTGAFVWEVDPAVVAAANVLGTSQLREQLVPVLSDAHAHHAVGYDRLRVAICGDANTMSASHARVCSTLPGKAEDQWRRQGVRPWLTRGALTLGYGGAIALTYATRDGEPSRPIATVAGVAGGYTAGVSAIYFGAKAVHYDTDHPDVGFEALIVGSAVAGGVLGGIGAHALAASPGARVPVTAVGLAPLYVLTIATTFE